jgi:hypothetical protein
MGETGAKLKDSIETQIAVFLQGRKEVSEIVVYGSFLTIPSPNDVDVIVFQDRQEEHLSLAMKYRRLTRDVARILPLDIIPVRMGISESTGAVEIDRG